MNSQKEMIHSNKFFKIYKEKTHYLEYHGNEKGIIGSSVLITNEKENKFLLIKNHREAIRQDSWEAPRGGADGIEGYRECALRESKEETGYTIKISKSLGWIAPESGTMTSKFEVFQGIADENEIPETVDTDDEIIEVKWIKKEELLGMVNSGEIVCGITLSLILRYLLS